MPCKGILTASSVVTVINLSDCVCVCFSFFFVVLIVVYGYTDVMSDTEFLRAAPSNVGCFCQKS